MEKKRAYVKPSLESEAFVPNTYVAACGDSGTTYLFECNAGEPYRYWQPGIFGGGHWVTDDHPYKVTTDGGRVLTRNYGPCNAKHSAPSESGFCVVLWIIHIQRKMNIYPLLFGQNGEGMFIVQKILIKILGKH